MARNRELEAEVAEEEKEGPAKRGSQGSVSPLASAPSAGPQVFGCRRCLARFNNYEKLQQHQRKEHGM